MIVILDTDDPTPAREWCERHGHDHRAALTALNMGTAIRLAMQPGTVLVIPDMAALGTRPKLIASALRELDQTGARIILAKQGIDTSETPGAMGTIADTIVAQIRARADLLRDTIAVRRRNGWAWGPAELKSTPARRARIKQLRDEGHSIRTIAKRVKLSKSRVWVLLKDTRKDHDEPDRSPTH
jgi:DNA invertase Pin-like site-specific DNA recombinase